jgi:hypothetical protein
MLFAWRIQHRRPFPKPITKDNVVWVSQYYESPSPLRQSEINRSLLHNLQLPWISLRLLAVDSNTGFNTDYIYETLAATRLLFTDYLKIVDRYSSYQPNSIVILTNSDIELTQDIVEMLPWIQEHDVVCLSRHEHNEHRFKHPPEWLQDCWIMRAQNISPYLIRHSNFSLGIPGCDNHFAAIMHEAGFRIWNPCISIRTYHHHHSSVRSHGSTERIKGPYYEPYACTLEEYIMRRNPGGRIRRGNEIAT